jgi:hypothetical protein
MLTGYPVMMVMVIIVIIMVATTDVKAIEASVRKLPGESIYGFACII